MKIRSTRILASLFVMLASVAFASPRNKTTINLDQPTVVTGTVLEPGDYSVEWNGAGPDVQVSFFRHGESVVIAPATLQPAQNGFSSVSEQNDPSGAHSLLEIRTKNSTLRFASPVPSDGK